MSTQAIQADDLADAVQADDLSDLLPDDLQPGVKHKAVPLVRSAKQRKQAGVVARREAAVAKQAELQTQSARLAQIVNLHIGGYSLSQIGVSIGATAEEVDRLLAQDTARYVRSQPALRTYVRNWVSERYMKMIEADWDAASDASHREKLEHQDRVMRMLKDMAKLHGAEAPTQTEVKVETAPETVDRLVQRLAASQGLGYDTDIFDIVDAEEVHEAVEETAAFLETSSHDVSQTQEGDPDAGF